MKKALMFVISMLMIASCVFAGCSAPAKTSSSAAAATTAAKATEAAKTSAASTTAAAATSAAATQATTSGGATTGSNASTSTTDYSSLISSKLPKGDWYIGFANGYMGNTWRAQFVECFEGFCEALKQQGIIGKYTVASTSGDVTEQLNQINNMISEGVNCICLNPISPASVTPIKQLCDDAGVLLVIDTDPAGVDKDLTEVLVDNRDFFAIMTKWFINKLGGKGNIVQITGTPGMPATIVRQAVAKNLLKDTDIKVLGSSPGSWSETDAQTAMSTFLSTYDKIDGVLTEDVMAEGIIRAYETAGKDVPVMTGDYVMSFFRKWQTMPNLEAAATTFQPQGAIEGVQYAIRVLNGQKLDTSKLGTNPLDETMKNAINIPPSYCITKDKPSSDEEWLQGYNLTQFISLDDALKIGADLSDTAAIGSNWTADTWDSMFK